MLTQERLRQLFRYDPETGEFARCLRNDPRQVGTVATNGYLRIWVDGKQYAAHRLAWLYVYGVLPEAELDHKDRNKLNNRIGNLREATRGQNIANSMRRDNRTGVRGVFYHAQNKNWCVQVASKHRGSFACFGKAAKCARDTRKMIYGGIATCA